MTDPKPHSWITAVGPWGGGGEGKSLIYDKLLKYAEETKMKENRDSTCISQFAISSFKKTPRMTTWRIRTAW